MEHARTNPQNLKCINEPATTFAFRSASWIVDANARPSNIVYQVSLQKELFHYESQIEK
ncbi:hypothetical protein BH10CHL1_BH10CHL1_25660 [soil metagenome]